MKIFLILLLFSSSVLAEEIVVTMEHGSKVRGKCSLDAFTVNTGFGELKLPVAEIVTVSKSGEKFSFRMVNGSLVIGKLVDEAFNLKAKFFNLNVKWSQLESISVSRNKSLVNKVQWSPVVNGLGMRMVSKGLYKRQNSQLLKIVLEVKNFSDSFLRLPAPSLAMGYVSEDVDSHSELFFLAIKYKEETTLTTGCWIASEIITSSVMLSSGKSFKVCINIDFRKDLAEELLQEEVATALDDKIYNFHYSERLVQGEYELSIGMRNFYRKNVWIKDQAQGLGNWTGVIKCKPFDLKVD